MKSGICAWHLRNVTSDLFQWPLTGVAQVPLFDLVAFFEFYSGCCEGGWGGVRSAVIALLRWPKEHSTNHSPAKRTLLPGLI